jgi:hypothetical protein
MEGSFPGIYVEWDRKMTGKFRHGGEISATGIGKRPAKI